VKIVEGQHPTLIALFTATKPFNDDGFDSPTEFGWKFGAL
jgi:hypothetical protein